MTGVCFRREHSAGLQDQWSFVFSNFGVEDIWERGFVADDLKIYQPTIPIETAEELPDRPLVVLAPVDGRDIRGTESLVDFKHPDQAIYLFGGSHVNLTTEGDLGNRVPDHVVYIPTKEHEMYSYCAAYIVLYDLLVKRSG